MTFNKHWDVSGTARRIRAAGLRIGNRETDFDRRRKYIFLAASQENEERECDKKNDNGDDKISDAEAGFGIVRFHNGQF